MVAPTDEALDGLLAEYELGTLSPPERAEVEALLVAPEVRARLDVVRARLSAAAAPGPWTGFNGVLAWLEGGRRFHHLLPALAAHFDLTSEAAEALAQTLDDDDVWVEGTADGVEGLVVDAGPRLAGRAPSVYRVHPGFSLPLPAGAEVLVLEGALRDAAGQELWRGATATASGALTALPGPVVLVGVVRGGRA